MARRSPLRDAIPIVLERESAARDATYNEPVATWTTVAETWAQKRATGAGERFVDGAQHSSEEVVEYTLRWRRKLDPRWRIREVRTGEVYEILGAYDPDGRRRRVVVKAKTFQPDTNAEKVL